MPLLGLFHQKAARGLKIKDHIVVYRFMNHLPGHVMVRSDQSRKPTGVTKGRSLYGPRATKLEILSFSLLSHLPNVVSMHKLRAPLVLFEVPTV